VPVSGLTNVVAVAAGGDHSLALLADGTVRGWGSNFIGQLADGSFTSRRTPTRSLGTASPQPNLVEVRAGANSFASVLALDSGGTLWGWGSLTALGQAGAQRTKPVAVLGGVRTAATSGNHYLAVLDNGTMRAWGFNGLGTIGDGTSTDRLTPVTVTGVTNVAAAAAGLFHSLALRGDGTVLSWGNNFFGELGRATNVGSNTANPTPQQIAGLSGVIAVAALGSHSLALLNDGTVRGWGANTLGQLGDSSLVNRSSPVRAGTLTGIVAIAAGGEHSLALASDGSVWAWGGNSQGQLGDGSTTNRTSPVRVAGLTDVVGIAAGGAHSLAVKSDGTVWAWGSNGSARLGFDDGIGLAPTPRQISGLLLFGYVRPLALPRVVVAP
jgi:alpha-tubulin suppressor-like RCC1 family protein